MRVFFWIFSFWIILLPFVTWRGLYEPVKVRWFLAGGIGLVLFWITRFFRKKQFFISRSDLWYLGFLATLTVSSLLGVHPLDSILGGSYRHQGVLFFVVLWLVGKTLEVFDSRKRKILIQMFVVNICLVIVFRTIGEPNALAGFLAISAPLVLFWRLKRFLKIIFIVITALTIFLTQSYVGMASFVVGMSILFMRRRSLLVVSLTIGIGFLWVLHSSIAPSSEENRRIIWKIAVQSIAKRPLLGYGAESGEVVFEKGFWEFRRVRLINFMVDRAHNLALDLFMWSGLIGFICFVMWFWGMLKEVIKNKQWMSLAVATGFLVYGSFQPLSVVHWVIFMVSFYLS